MKALVVLAMLGSALPTLAQPVQVGELPLPSSRWELEPKGWTLAPMFRTTWVHGRSVDMVGLRAAVTFQHGLALGLAGAGFVPGAGTSEPPSPGAGPVQGGYGGALVEYVVALPRSLEIGVDAVVGAGGGCVGVGVAASAGRDAMACQSHAAFFLFEPGATVALQIAPAVRLGLGGGYRFADASGWSGANVTTSLTVGRR